MLLAHCCLISVLFLGVWADIKYGRFDRIEMCDLNRQYPIDFKVLIENDVDYQTFNVSALFTIPLGLNQTLNLTLEYSINERELSEIVNVSKPVCSFFEEDLGELRHEIHELAGIPKGTCPINPGSYFIFRYPLEYKEINFDGVVKAKLRATINILGEDTDEIVSCFIMEYSLLDDDNKAM